MPQTTTSTSWFLASLSRAKDTFENAGKHKLYPGGIFGTPQPVPVNSNRRNAKSDIIKTEIGEAYRAPNDPFMAVQQKATEEPGVLAGFSHRNNLPKLKGGRLIRSKHYAYAPLARRLDNDRLFRALRERRESLALGGRAKTWRSIRLQMQPMEPSELLQVVLHIARRSNCVRNWRNR